VSEPGPNVAPRDLHEFLADAAAFLNASCERRGASRQDSAPRRVALFNSMSPEAESEVVHQAKAWRRLVWDAGFAWISGPLEYGGRALPRSYESAYHRLERDYVTPSKQPFLVSLGMVAPTLLLFGSETMKHEWLPRLYRGEMIGCQLFSEPGAGSDLAAIETRATRLDDHWSVSGQKVWTSWAHRADLGLLVAKTSEGPRHHNLTAMVVNMRAPGIVVRPLRHMAGGADFNEVFFDGALVPDHNRLGDIGHGWEVLVATLKNERAAVSDPATAGAGIFNFERLKEMMRRRGLGDDSTTRQDLARLYTLVTTAKFSRARAEAGQRAGRPPGPEMSLAKLSQTRNLRALSSFVSHVLGPEVTADTDLGDGYLWSEFILTVPGTSIGGGTDEVNKNIVAERVLGLPRA
jgi:alkylation response protein AidB-like acyl-CoA dehydrogenase